MIRTMTRVSLLSVDEVHGLEHRVGEGVAACGPVELDGGDGAVAPEAHAAVGRVVAHGERQDTPIGLRASSRYYRVTASAARPAPGARRGIWPAPTGG
jgi:hypothetical protein